MKKLRGYLTPEGYLGEIKRDVWKMFPTEEEWEEYKKDNHLEDGENSEE